MSVYVDDMKAKHRGMIMCHMLADTEKELREMAAKIGVSMSHHQFPGTHKSHFDICLKKRSLAIKFGAIEITQHQTGKIIKQRLEAV